MFENGQKDIIKSVKILQPTTTTRSQAWQTLLFEMEPLVTSGGGEPRQ